MRIINGTEGDIAYELKGGPLRMTLSKCLLEAGEEEVWTSPYRRHQLAVACELHVLVDDEPYMVEAHDTDTIVVKRTPEGIELAVRRAR